MRASWRVHFQLGRVSNLPTVWSNVLAGATLAALAPPAAGSVVLVAVAVSLLYVAGMYLNDAFDREVDAAARPDRPIPSGRIAARSVFAWGLALLFAGWQLVLLHELTRSTVNVAVPVAAGALAGAIVLYNAWHKDNPLGPALMGACRALVYITAAFAIAGAAPTTVLAAAAAVFAYTIGLTSIAKQEGHGRGPSGSALPGLPSPERRVRRDRVRGLGPVLLIMAAFVYAIPAASTVAGAALYGAFLCWTIYSLLLLRRPRNTGRVVVSLIAGMSLLDAVLIARAGLPGTAAFAALGFPLALFFQRYVRGT